MYSEGFALYDKLDSRKCRVLEVMTVLVNPHHAEIIPIKQNTGFMQEAAFSWVAFSVTCAMVLSHSFFHPRSTALERSNVTLWRSAFFGFFIGLNFDCYISPTHKPILSAGV